jgi:exonuclease SbcD
MPKILHFADAHIDMANYGRHDPQTGLPLRVLDFLKSLDEIVDAAIDEKVDLVIFAGDAYKDRNPQPTFQREWGKRMMRLSRADIPTLLLVGNHDVSPALGRAHALETFDTLEVPFVRVVDRPTFLGPEDLFGVSLQVMAIPWISRSGLIAALGDQVEDASSAYEMLDQRLAELVDRWFIEKADPALPVVLTAHCSVQGATYGGERTVMLGNDLVLSPGFVKDPRLDYVALGHIHKPQDLNPGLQPPVVYPGSIERVDFGEAQDDKFFIIAQVERKATTFEWRKLKNLRPFFDCFVRLEDPDGISDRLRAALPAPDQLVGAILRLVIEYARDWETSIDDAALRDYAKEAFEFHLIKRPQSEIRVRLPGDQAIGSLSPLELLEKYWLSSHTDSSELDELNQLAESVLREVGGGSTT